MNIIIGMLAYAGRSQLWMFSVPIVLINTLVRLTKRQTDFIHVVANTVVGICLYVAHEKYTEFVVAVYLMKLVQLVVLFRTRERPAAVKSLAVLVFDVLYRRTGLTSAFASVFVLHFVSQLLKDYNK